LQPREWSEVGTLPNFVYVRRGSGACSLIGRGGGDRQPQAASRKLVARHQRPEGAGTEAGRERHPALATGVYFVREASGDEREVSRVTKVIVTR